MKSAVAVCLVFLLLSVVSTNAQFGHPYYPYQYYRGPFGGPGFGNDRLLGLIGAGALISRGNPLGQTVGLAVGWGGPRWGPRWGPRGGAGRGLQLFGSLALLRRGGPIGRTFGTLGLLGALG